MCQAVFDFQAIVSTESNECEYDDYSSINWYFIFISIYHD